MSSIVDAGRRPRWQALARARAMGTSKRPAGDDVTRVDRLNWAAEPAQFADIGDEGHES